MQKKNLWLRGIRASFPIGLVVFFSSFFISTNAVKFRFDQGDVSIEFVGRYKPESFFGKNFHWLNNCITEDKIFYTKHTLDVLAHAFYGQESYGTDVAEFVFSVRNKGVWGDPTSIARTTKAPVKVGKAVVGEHKHAIPRHIFWMREIWLRFNLNEALGLPFNNHHTVTLGAFPFQLGRGISFGPAYAIGPDTLGFYSYDDIDQYAFGIKFSGEVIKKKVLYDLYASVLHNECCSFSKTGANIYGQHFGRRSFPTRGFGKLGYVVAGRLMLEAFDTEQLGRLGLEPYLMYHEDLEQKVEVIGDAQTRLATAGLAGEYTNGRFEFGFDTAFNFGSQCVKGIDRNCVQLKNVDCTFREYNSHVVDQNGCSIPHCSGSEAQKLIDCAEQNACQNCQEIGVIEENFCGLTAPIKLINKKNRFRSPYKNQFGGWMFVADGGYWIRPKELFLAGTFGIASGDNNPHERSCDKRYGGFVGLQEAYVGKRVRSAFTLGGTGRVPRILSMPRNTDAPNKFAHVVSGFTNLTFAGAGLQWTPRVIERKAGINPNVLFYWQNTPTRAFDARTCKELCTNASRFLGTEINCFSYVNLFPSLRMNFNASVFVPGNHYKDICGKPLNATQQKCLDKLNKTGFEKGKVPNIGSNVAYTLNLGLEYRF